MEVAMDEVLKQGKLCEATLCYTGDILDERRDKYTLKYLSLIHISSFWVSVPTAPRPI